ncbi:MAG: aldehyde dehydrogenase (NADP(+)) [Phycisphaeraceae bacterium]|nr:aldehyde dehydrogenase (NADP(+)) [Phycisphaeraceae bacterium]
MTTHTLTGRNLIDGQWVGSDPKTTRAVNPATGAVLEPGFHAATADEIEQAFAAAMSAYAATRDLPATRWADLLDAIADQIMALGDQLLTTGQNETALPPARLTGERARTTGQLKLFAALIRDGSWVDAVIDRADPNRQPLPKPDVRRMNQSLGPVVVFGASNFPFAFGACGGDTASALAAGNPVLVKAHTGHPATNELFAAAVLAALRQTNLPTGLFSLLQGSGTKVGAAMVKHPAAMAVGFTGSKSGGCALFDLAAARPRPIPVYAEMGSLNPFVILPGALRERRDTIAEGLAGSITLGGGQFCTKPGLVFVLDGPDADAFVAKLTEKISAAPAFTLLNAGIQKSFHEMTGKFQQVDQVKVRVAGACTATAGATASLYEVTASRWISEATLRDEAFGPASLVVRCENERQLLDAIELAGGNLTGSIHTGSADDTELVRRIVRVFEQTVGRIVFNGYPTGVEVCHAMVHGGPYPATTTPGFTSVGTSAIRRFVRPVAYQNTPDALLPAELRNANPRGILRLIDGKATRDSI